MNPLRLREVMPTYIQLRYPDGETVATVTHGEPDICRERAERLRDAWNAALSLAKASPGDGQGGTR